MNRRPSLPGAAELFRRTSTEATPLAGGSPPRRAAPSRAGDSVIPLGLAAAGRTAQEQPRRTRPAQRPGVNADGRRSTGRERHEEKITVYCSAQELLDLESARLRLRGEHGLVVDRGRIVREAVAVVLADLDALGANSVLARRLRET